MHSPSSARRRFALRGALPIGRCSAPEEFCHLSRGRHRTRVTTRCRRQEQEAAAAAHLREEEERLRAAVAEVAELQRADTAVEAARRDQLLQDAIASEQAVAIRLGAPG